MAAIQTGSNRFEAHLATCEFCRTIRELLAIGLSDHENSQQSVPSVVYEAAALAAYDRARRPATRLVGAVGHDSWAGVDGPAVRDSVAAQERRLTLTADSYRLEVIIERRQDHWECVARLYKDKKPAANFILTAGRQKLHTQARRCYFWTAKTPPRRLSVSSGDVRIDFGTLTW